MMDCLAIYCNSYNQIVIKYEFLIDKSSVTKYNHNSAIQKITQTVVRHNTQLEGG